jgi:hypothetical protein
VQAVRVLGLVHPLQHAELVEALGQRQLDDVGVAGRVGVELRDGRLDLLLRRVLRQAAVDRADAHLGAVAVLHRHVGVRAGIVADQDRAEAWHDAVPGEYAHPLGQVLAELLRGQPAVQNRRRHETILADAGG